MWGERNKYVFRVLSVPLFVALLLSGCRIQEKSVIDAEEEYIKGIFAMGTYMSLTAYGESAESALELSEDRIKELEALWSVTDENSDIYKVNQSNGVPIEVSEETAEILQFALNMAEQTNGALEPTIFPLISDWGFISREYNIPTEDELADLMKYIDYKK